MFSHFQSNKIRFQTNETKTNYNFSSFVKVLAAWAVTSGQTCQCLLLSCFHISLLLPCPSISSSLPLFFPSFPFILFIFYLFLFLSTYLEYLLRTQNSSPSWRNSPSSNGHNNNDYCPHKNEH